MSRASTDCGHERRISRRLERALFPGSELLGEPRSADVWADTNVTCLELPIEEFNRFRREHPQIAECIARNLAAILAKRLIQANTKIDVLSAY